MFSMRLCLFYSRESLTIYARGSLRSPPLEPPRHEAIKIALQRGKSTAKEEGITKTLLKAPDFEITIEGRHQ